MSSVTPGTPTSRRGFWTGFFVGPGGGVLVAVLAAALLSALGFLAMHAIGGEVSMTPMTNWREAASETRLEVYEPGYLPPGTGEPELNTSGFLGLIPELEAAYPSGLMIVERDSGPAHDCGEAVQVRGVAEACFGTADSGARALAVKRGDTWIQVIGIADEEAVRVAESLRPAE